MSLRDKYIALKVKSIARIRTYYENKGYTLPYKIDNNGRKRLDVDKNIQVLISDLPDNSQAKVFRICDECNSVKRVHYFSIIKSRKRHNRKIDLCKGCSNREKERNSKSIKLDSDKLLSLEFVRCDEEFYEKYTPKDFNVTSNIKCLWRCTKCKYEWCCRISDKYLRKSICPNCSDRVLNERNSLYLNNKELMEEWDYSLNKVNPKTLTRASHDIVYWKCKYGHSWSTPVHSRTIMKSGCPKCNSSKGEKRIIKYLEDKVDYIHQKYYDDLTGTGGGYLTYDFYIPSLNLLIEYQGQFHDGNGGKGNDYITKNLKKQIKHDDLKKKYAEDKGIRLLEIWYWDFENIESILYNYLK